MSDDGKLDWKGFCHPNVVACMLLSVFVWSGLVLKLLGVVPFPWAVLFKAWGWGILASLSSMFLLSSAWRKGKE